MFAYKTLTLSFFLFLAIFAGIRILLALEIDFPNWIRFYVGDFLCMPIVLTICLFVAQYVKKDKSIELSLFSIFSLTSFYAIYFEIFLAEFHSRYTADLLDVIMYFSGALLFFFLQKQK